MSWSSHWRVVAARERWWAADLVVEAIDGWRRHQTSRNAAVLSYYGFLSVFPLMMVATTILGLLLSGDPDLRERLLDSAIAEFPVIGTQISQQATPLIGGWTTLVVGLIVALWASTKAFVSVQVAYDDIWEVPIDHRSNTAIIRGKALLGILIVATGVTATGWLSTETRSGLGQVAVIAGVMLINLITLMVMMRLMTKAPVTWAMTLPGAMASAAGLTILQLLGTWIVRRYLATASDVAGVFAIVFALMAWLQLQATAVLLGVEISAARHRSDHGVAAVDVVTLGTIGRAARLGRRHRAAATVDDQPPVSDRQATDRL